MHDKQYRNLGVFVLIVLGVLAFSTARTAGEKDGLLRVYVLDVGQGDAIFVEAPNGNQVLIDGGPDERVAHHLGNILPFSDRTLDLVVLTHPHSDHMQGLFEVLKRYAVGHILETRVTYDSSEFRQWREARTQEGAELIEAVAGKTIDLGADVALTVLYPLESLKGQEAANPNNSSAVILLKHRDVSILFTGDIETKGERELITNRALLDADVLKVAHHGSRTSTTQLFLDEVSPKVALISVGERNRYRHPSPDILSRLEKSGIPYYRTDTNGTVVVESDGNAFRVTTRK